jgi:diketogulonate reductase-like aldo/keto reductase
VLELPELEEIARVHSRSVSQVVLRWHLQRGYCVIPKSSRPDRIAENADVFDFDLTSAEIARISGLHRNFRTGVDPNDRN